MITKLLKRDFLLAIKSSNGLILTFIILLISMLLYSFMSQAETSSPAFFVHNILLTIAFSSLLSSNILFFDDLDDGSTEQMIICGVSHKQIILAKVIFHFIISAVPIIIAEPIMAEIFKVKIATNFILVIAIISISFSFSSVYCALVISLLNNNTLIGNLILLPLMIAPLIVGKLNIDHPEYFSLLCGLCLIISASSFLMSYVVYRDKYTL